MPFDILFNHDNEYINALLKNDVEWRGDGTYIGHREKHEMMLRDKFIEKLGNPKRQWPIYAILGDSPLGPHDLEREYYYKLIIPLDVFKCDEISFTYPDSLYEVPIDDLGRMDLERNIEPIVYTINEIENVIRSYKVYEYKNHYVEAQIWNDENVGTYLEEEKWIRCIER